MQAYYRYTSYSRYVNFKKLDFIIQVVTQQFAPITNVRGLDLGCGKGDVTIPLAFLGYQMVGVDILPEAIKLAKSRKAKFLNSRDFPRFLVGDVENLAISEKASDFIICSEVLEHLNHPKIALTSINKILKEKGLLIVTVPNGHGPYSLIFDRFRNKVISKIFPKIGLSDHVQAFTLPKITNLIKEAEFEVLNVNHSDFISFLPILVKSNRFSYCDCKLADKLPSPLVSGYYIACKKK